MLCDGRRRSRVRGDEPPEARGGGAGPPLRRRVALPDRGVLVGGGRARAAAGAPLRLARRGPLAPAATPAAAAARAARRPPRRRLPGRPPRARAREPGGGRARDRAAAPRRAVPLGGRRLGPARAGGARRRPPLRLLARDRARGRVGSAPTLAPADAAPRARDQSSGAPGVRTTGAPRCAPRLRHLACESRLARGGRTPPARGNRDPPGAGRPRAVRAGPRPGLGVDARATDDSLRRTGGRPAQERRRPARGLPPPAGAPAGRAPAARRRAAGARAAGGGRGGRARARRRRRARPGDGARPARAPGGVRDRGRRGARGRRAGRRHALRGPGGARARLRRRRRRRGLRRGGRRGRALGAPPGSRPAPRGAQERPAPRRARALERPLPRPARTCARAPRGRGRVTEVTAVVASYRSAAFLPACLESLAAQTRPPAEVVVVDGSSPDDSVAVARRHGARVLERANRGLGWLYNEGARASETELLLLANADVAFAPGCLEALAGALAADPTLFAADARQLDWAGGRTLHARTAIRRGPLLRTAIPGLAVDPAAPPHRGPPVPTAWANAGAMLVRRARLLDLGGFDERFFLDFEDVDLCWRAWLRGWPSVHVPEAVVRHGSRARPRRRRCGGASSPPTRTSAASRSSASLRPRRRESSSPRCSAWRARRRSSPPPSDASSSSCRGSCGSGGRSGRAESCSTG